MTLTTAQQLRRDLRRAVADYMSSEGCSCCRDYDRHKENAETLAKLLNIPEYPDGSGYNFAKYRTPNQNEGGKS